MSISSYDTIVGEGKSGYVYQDPLMFNSTVLPISGKDREWVECLFAPAYQELLDVACQRYYKVPKIGLATRRISHLHKRDVWHSWLCSPIYPPLLLILRTPWLRVT